MTRSILLLFVCLCACGEDVAASELGDEMPEDVPPGSCRDTDVGGTDDGDTDGCDAATSTGLATTSTTTGEVESECVGEDDCDGAGACVAEWSEDEGERGPFECQFACIPTLDEATWCSDDASCCDADATCTPRGYCVVVGDAVGGSSSGG